MHRFHFLCSVISAKLFKESHFIQYELLSWSFSSSTVRVESIDLDLKPSECMKHWVHILHLFLRVYSVVSRYIGQRLKFVNRSFLAFVVITSHLQWTRYLQWSRYLQWTGLRWIDKNLTVFVHFRPGSVKLQRSLHSDIDWS